MLFQKRYILHKYIIHGINELKRLFKILAKVEMIEEITHEERSNKSPFHVIGSLLPKTTANCLSSLIFLPKSLM